MLGHSHIKGFLSDLIHPLIGAPAGHFLSKVKGWRHSPNHVKVIS